MALTTDPDDVANPDCDQTTLERARRTDPAALGPAGGDLLRFAWASAALHAHPELHDAWARTADRAVRRAIMRSPRLTAAAAEAVVDTRRSGMHTLGANPITPAELLVDNPGAQRRRAAVTAIVPAGLDEVATDPNRAELVELGSGTIDLVLATAEGLDLDTAVLLAERSHPAADPFVLARLVDRFGIPAWEALGRHASRERRRVVAALSEAAAHLLDTV